MFGKKQLGQGTYAVVHEVERNGTLFAAKVIRHETYEEYADDVNREISILSSMSHPNVPRLFDVIKTEENIVLILDLCKGGELFDALVMRESFNEKDAASIMNQLLRGVRHLHAKNVVHRDLKPENLLFKNANDILTGLTGRDHSLLSLPLTSASSARLWFCCSI